jgi:hypothetical protein
VSGGVTARRVADRLCHRGTVRKDGYTAHTGHVFVGDGGELVHALDAYRTSGPLRLLSNGGDFPLTLAVAADDERALIYYVEGDLEVRFYDDEDGYRDAIREWEGGQA